MTLRLWIEINHQAPYRTGGWAWLRQDGKALAGAAGGERDIDAEAFCVHALRAALVDLPAETAVALHLSEPLLIEGVRTMSARRAAGWKTEAGEDSPDAEAWEAVAKALAGRGLSLVRTQPTDARSPAGFAAAWAELGRDKAKTKGTFKNAIPRPNLTKIRGL
jgi:ribonuclease HI